MTTIHFPNEMLDLLWHQKRGKLREMVGLPPSADKEDRFPASFSCSVPLSGGPVVRAFSVGDHIFVSHPGERSEGWNLGAVVRKFEKADKPFIKVEVIGNAFISQIDDPYDRRKPTIKHEYNPNEVNAFFSDDYRFTSLQTRHKEDRVQYAHLNVKVTADDGTVATGRLYSYQPTQGAAKLSPDPNDSTVFIETEFYGMRNSWRESMSTKTTVKHKSGYGWRNSYDSYHHSFNPLATLIVHTHGSVLAESKDEWWARFFKFNPPTSFWDRHTGQLSQVPLDMDGIAASLKKKGIKETLERLEKESPVDFTFFQWLMNGKTVEKRKNNSMLSAMLAKIGQDYNLLRDALRNCRLNTIPRDLGRHGYHEDQKQGNWFAARREFCMQLPGVKDLIDEQEAKADWTKRRDNSSQADGLGVHAAAFPMLRASIEAGDIPTGVFVQPGPSGGDRTPVNIEFDLWEKALQRGWGETLSKIAKNASARTTYERDITPFLAFCFKIEKFLKKHAGKKWVAIPSFVESQWQLEMEETDDDKATVKRRSALTPVANNEDLTVTVPYVALAVSGVRTQWCYSRHYHLFEEGFTDPISGGVVTKDFETKLNGRDDYGLCFYTLTGTDTARGYPTFLIIFERLASGPRIHFHRVHPHRSQKGITTPACRLVESCYQYMAGNIPASEVVAQQGDLIFIKCGNDPVAAGAKVGDPQTGRGFEFESHQFRSKSFDRLQLFPNLAKTPQNRLGFLHATAAFRVEHPEHEHISDLHEGWWEIRRCKSWEANPKSIWSRTID